MNEPNGTREFTSEDPEMIRNVYMFLSIQKDVRRVVVYVGDDAIKTQRLKDDAITKLLAWAILDGSRDIDGGNIGATAASLTLKKLHAVALELLKEKV